MDKKLPGRGTTEEFQSILYQIANNMDAYSINKDYRVYSDALENIFHKNKSWSKEEFCKELEAIIEKINSNDTGPVNEQSKS